MVKVGDLIPQASGSSHLGIDGMGQPIAASFDITSLAPFGHIHQLSGIFHDPIQGQSGVLRFSLEQAAFQVSVDGGATFQNLSAGGVDSVGVIGDTNLTGNVDLASPSSGFIAIFDTADASPINFAVDQLSLSGLWDFPSQGFNGSIVNSLTDFNGTTAQGAITLQGASGILVDIVGQTVTIGAAAEFVRCRSETFGAATEWTMTHNLGSSDVVVMAYDGSNFLIIPDKVEITDTNTVTVSFNVATAGKLVVFACN